MPKMPYISLVMCSRLQNIETTCKKSWPVNFLQVSNLTFNYMMVLTSDNISWVLLLLTAEVFVTIFQNLNVVANLQHLQAGVLTC